MIQFSLNRFGKLAHWTLINDKRYYVKSFLQMLVIFTLGFLFFTTATVKWNNQSANYVLCDIVTVATFAFAIVMGSSYMFYSMDGKHDMQTLLMLPASNLEKYLMRYSTWIILLPLYVVAFLAADVFQYVANTLLGQEETVLVVQHVTDSLAKSYGNTTCSTYLSMVLIFGWVHSLYALGATFFRWRKYNWVCTTTLLIVLGILLFSIFTGDRISGSIDMDTAIVLRNVSAVVCLFMIALNFWLSYRIFCRTQLVGRFVNL